MRKLTAKFHLLLITTLLLSATAFSEEKVKAPKKTDTGPKHITVKAPKNIIFFIGDGMGFEQVKAAGMYVSGKAGTLCFEKLPHQGQVTTYAADVTVTDSAAAGTSIATGVKVNKGIISVQIPGDGAELKTMLEHFQAKGKAVGLVTTTHISHATPAAFGAHEKSRNNYKEIIQDYLTQTKPDVLMGGAKYITPIEANKAGYRVVTDCKELLALNTDKVKRLSGQFGKQHMPYEYDGLGELPHLSDMTKIAIDIIDNDPDGFFIMIEGGRIDHAGHANSLEKNIFETLEFARTIEQTLKWAKGRKDTLIIVTADHETGGMTVTETDPAKNKLPAVAWKTDGHTSVNAPVYAWGFGAEQFVGVMDNTDFFLMITDPLITTAVKIK